MPASSLSKKVYWPLPTSSFAMLLVSIVLSHSPARGTARDQLAHVRNIEDADGVSHRLVFLHDAAVLHRHEPAAEGDDFRAQPDVFVVKRSAFFPGVTHRGQPRCCACGCQSPPPLISSSCSCSRS